MLAGFSFELSLGSQIIIYNNDFKASHKIRSWQRKAFRSQLLLIFGWRKNIRVSVFPEKDFMWHGYGIAAGNSWHTRHWRTERQKERKNWTSGKWELFKESLNFSGYVTLFHTDIMFRFIWSRLGKQRKKVSRRKLWNIDKSGGESMLNCKLFLLAWKTGKPKLFQGKQRQPSLKSHC